MIKFLTISYRKFSHPGHSQAFAQRAHSITFVPQLADVSIDRLLHHGKARWLNCPDEVIRSGTLKKYPVSPRIGKKMTPGTMHLFGKNNNTKRKKGHAVRTILYQLNMRKEAKVF